MLYEGRLGHLMGDGHSIQPLLLEELSQDRGLMLHLLGRGGFFTSPGPRRAGLHILQLWWVLEKEGATCGGPSPPHKQWILSQRNQVSPRRRWQTIRGCCQLQYPSVCVPGAYKF